MKRYVRTKDGNIIDTKWNRGDYVSAFIKIHKGIDKTSDTIKKLIKAGDLVRIENRLFEVDEYLLKYKQDFEITELYTKQGNNYILVARKENGEWIIL